MIVASAAFNVTEEEERLLEEEVVKNEPETSAAANEEDVALEAAAEIEPEAVETMTLVASAATIDTERDGCAEDDAEASFEDEAIELVAPATTKEEAEALIDEDATEALDASNDATLGASGRKTRVTF